MISDESLVSFYKLIGVNSKAWTTPKLVSVGGLVKFFDQHPHHFHMGLPPPPDIQSNANNLEDTEAQGTCLLFPFSSAFSPPYSELLLVCARVEVRSWRRQNMRIMSIVSFSRLLSLKGLSFTNKSLSLCTYGREFFFAMPGDTFHLFGNSW